MQGCSIQKGHVRSNNKHSPMEFIKFFQFKNSTLHGPSGPGDLILLNNNRITVIRPRRLRDPLCLVFDDHSLIARMKRADAVHNAPEKSLSSKIMKYFRGIRFHAGPFPRCKDNRAIQFCHISSWIPICRASRPACRVLPVIRKLRSRNGYATTGSPTWTRTKTKGSKDPCAAITPWGNWAPQRPQSTIMAYPLVTGTQLQPSYSERG